MLHVYISKLISKSSTLHSQLLFMVRSAKHKSILTPGGAVCILSLAPEYCLCCMQERPPGHSAIIIIAAVLYADVIKLCSETGRLHGHLHRRQLCRGGVLARFDWFGGLVPEVREGIR